MIESLLELLDGFSCALVVSDFVRNGEQKQNCRLPVPTHLSSNSNIYISNGSFSQVICFLSLKKQLQSYYQYSVMFCILVLCFGI